MKKLYILAWALLLSAISFAQTTGFSYQAIVRNANGELVKSKTIGMQITILKGSNTGTQVYTETLIPLTNANGLVTLEIGKGNPSFSGINWADGPYFLKTETDPAGGTSYTISGTSQLLSVPYAMYALKAGNSFSGSYLDLTNKPALFSGSYLDLSNKPAMFSGNYTDLTNKPQLSTVATTGSYIDLTNKPTLSIVAATGSYTDLLNKPALFSGSYLDLTNKPALFSGSYTDLTNKPTFATVATTGSYNDLLNKPNTIILTATPKSGDMVYNNGSGWVLLAKGTDGQTLRLDAGIPKWSESGYSLPVITTLPVNDIMQTTAISGGNIIASGFTDVIARGVCWAVTQNPTIANSKTADGTGTGTFTSNLNSLLSNTTYYARAYATNGAGTAYGNQVTFKTFQTIVFPTVTTATVYNITKTGGTGGGNVTSTGGADVTARGICWSKTQNPTIDNNKTIEGSGTGQYVSPISGLEPGTMYYAKAYATNSSGTGYGSQTSFTAVSSVPIVATWDPSNILETNAVTSGTVISDGGSTVTERGICLSWWSLIPSTSDWVINNGIGTGKFFCTYSTLMPDTTIYVRAYALNVNGVSYGETKSFKTLDAYYAGFETGIPAGWSGRWAVSTDTPFEGFYCLKSVNVNDSVQFTRTVLNPDGGQFSFFHKSEGGCSYSNCPNINTYFYIDNVLQGNILDEAWTQHTYVLSTGSHTFKWINKGGGYNNNTYIDYIICTK